MSLATFFSENYQQITPDKKRGIFVCWYPEDIRPFSHLHLRINNGNDRIYFSFKSKIHQFDLNTATLPQRSFAERINRYEFKILASSRQISQIYNFVKEGEKALLEDWSCSSSTCAILRRFNLLSVPFPISQFPLTTAGYLFRQKALGNPQVQNIKFIGSDQNRIKAIVSPAVFGEIVVIALVILAISYTVFNKAIDICS